MRVVVDTNILVRAMLNPGALWVRWSTSGCSGSRARELALRLRGNDGALPPLAGRYQLAECRFSSDSGPCSIGDLSAACPRPVAM